MDNCASRCNPGQANTISGAGASLSGEGDECESRGDADQGNCQYVGIAANNQS